MSPTSNDVLVLTEYGEGVVDLGPEALQRLRRRARGRLRIAPGDAADRWVIGASSYVGTIVTPDLHVLIKPKVAIANLFLLLEASGRSVPLGPAVFDYERSNDLVPAFATFYAQHLETALARGIPRNYRERQERLISLKGRLDIPAQRRLVGLAVPVECCYDEYSADTQLNRLLLGAVSRLRRLPGVTVTTRQALQALVARLEGVGTVRPSDLRTSTRFTRLNEHCRAAEHLARIVLEGASVRDEAGSAGAAEFLVDMNALFEAFVEASLRRHLKRHLDVESQHPTWLDADGRVRMKPDLVFRRAGEMSYVADSKYKLTADGLGQSPDYYQLLAYTSALDLDEGLLIYCQHDGAVPPQEVSVRHLGKRLRTQAIQLDGPPADVEQQMRTLAQNILERVNKAERRIA